MKKIFFFVILIFLQFIIMAQEKPTLIYFGDPMCSWCYGFSPEFNKAVETLGDRLDVELVMGGLRPYNTQTMTDLGDFLKHHWEEVHQRSGQPFQYDILRKKDLVYDTEPACRAVVTVRQMNPALAFSFFKAVQHSFYAENRNPNLTETFATVAEQLGVDKNEFKRLFESEEMKNMVREDFTYAGEMDVRGFPTVILKNGDDLYLLSNGYTEAVHLLEQVKRIVGN